MAEIIDRFDLVALQEVWDDLRALDRLRDRLGHQVSDVTKATPVTGNVGLPRRHTQGPVLGNGGGTRTPTGRKGRQDGAATQVTRTPLMAAFQVGWTKFVLATVHIIYGDKTAEPVARVEEIRQIARFLRHRTDIKTEPIRNIIILGALQHLLRQRRDTAGDRTPTVALTARIRRPHTNTVVGGSDGDLRF